MTEPIGDDEMSEKNPEAPVIEVVSGSPTPEELAAVVTERSWATQPSKNAEPSISATHRRVSIR